MVSTEPSAVSMYFDDVKKYVFSHSPVQYYRENGSTVCMIIPYTKGTVHCIVYILYVYKFVFVCAVFRLFDQFSPESCGENEMDGEDGMQCCVWVLPRSFHVPQ